MQGQGPIGQVLVRAGLFNVSPLKGRYFLLSFLITLCRPFKGLWLVLIRVGKKLIIIGRIV